ncbi:MAG: T9SS type A sorting domain-containing protein, partial [Ginsengibacter sp.]
ANSSNNFYLFIDDISITSPSVCNGSAPPVTCNLTTVQASRGVASNTAEPTAPIASANELTVKVLANPSASAFSLNIKSSSTVNVTLRITDLFGRTLKVIDHVQSNATLNIGEDLPRGNYVVEVKQNTITKVLKLVKL